MAIFSETLPDDVGFYSAAAQKLNSWPLMEQPWLVLAIVTLYLVFVTKIGPTFMRNRKPFPLQPLILLYNAYQVCMNVFLLSWLYTVEDAFAYLWKHSCHPDNPAENHFWMEYFFYGWWFFVSRMIDMVDMVFFVLTKKYSSITCLHVFHHCDVALFTYYFLKYWPGEQLLAFCILNSFVHVIMYTYYFISALGPRYRKYLWWKSYLTQLQLAQFVILLAHATALILADCSVSRTQSYVLLVQYSLFFGLFGHFYWITYLCSDNRRKKIESDFVSGIGNAAHGDRTPDAVRHRSSRKPHQNNALNKSYPKVSSETCSSSESDGGKVDAEKVRKYYEQIADMYDWMTSILSFGQNKVWKQILIRYVNPDHGMHLLDVAGGTGLVAFVYLEYLKKLKNPKQLSNHVTVCDNNETMLSLGRDRASALGYDGTCIEWIVADAESLPVQSQSISAYTISFGLRHVARIDNALAEAYRVLKPGGRFACLEFSRVNNYLLRRFLEWYGLIFIPVIRQIAAGQWRWNPRQYVTESARKFPSQEVFKGMLEQAGFRSVTYENFNFGLIAIHCGVKPSALGDPESSNEVVDTGA